MQPPNILPCIPESLSDKLRRRTDELLCRTIRANYNTQFAQTAFQLTEFRRATANSGNGVDDDTLSDVFRKTVHLTTYDAYAPFIQRLFDKPCKASAIVDLLAPGLPDFLTPTSSTSGGISKTFLKYHRLSVIRSSDISSRVISDPPQRRTKAFVCYLWCDRMDVEEAKDCPVKTIYACPVSALNRRLELNLDPEEDKARMGTFILNHAAPYAAGFIKNWRSFLLVHALFAVSSKSIETMFMVFITTFVDMMRHLDAEFEVVVDCIANGTIPYLDGIDEVRHYLEPNLLPDPERAAELRSLGRPSSRLGWCSLVWPKLRSVTSIVSGSFASSLPLAESYLGPNAGILSGLYGSTEALIGSPYNPLKLNQFKLIGTNVVEFLDFNKDDSVDAIKQLWGVEVGRRYEIVLTTSDGLWRYRLGDVVEIAGFDPTDGIPVFEFVERLNAVMRFTNFMLTEGKLRAAMSSVPQTILPNVVEWTATTDDRRVPSTIGFFVELADDHVSDLALDAPDHVLDALLRSDTSIAWAVAHELFRKPTLWLVCSGTFSDFRQLKLEEGSHNVGQIKVPPVLPKAAYVTWFANRVVREL